MKKKSKAERQLELVGRRQWDRNPVTRVVPDKKKPKPDRKAKHKGRRYADPDPLRGLWNPARAA